MPDNRKSIAASAKLKSALKDLPQQGGRNALFGIPEW
jgi:hypothetical protein